MSELNSDTQDLISYWCYYPRPGCVVGLPGHDGLLACKPIAVLEFLFQMMDQDFSQFSHLVYFTF